MIEVPFNIDRAYAFTVEGSKIAQRWVGIPWAFLSVLGYLSPMVAYYSKKWVSWLFLGFFWQNVL